ncbi:Cullin [Entamoeba marina]
MNVLKKAYSVLYEGESLKGVINFFEEYCFTIGNEAIKRWDSKENLLKLVDIIITYYNTMKTLIQQSFDNHSLFQSAFTKVFRSIINENVVIKLDHIDVVFPEYLARYTDVVLRSGKDEEIIDNLSSVFEIYDNIDNKDIFETFYAKAISKRIMYLTIIKKFFSSSLCYKIQKMSRDISISHEMTTEFCNIVSVDFMFSVNVLQTAVWPVDPQQFLFNLPNELSNIHTLFSQWYSKQHQRRKLQWIHQYARGKISSTYLKKTYIFYGSAYQLSILLLFNGNDTYSIDEIFSIIQSRVDIITSIIQSLKDVGLLEQNDEQKYYLKQQYQSNKTKIVLPIPKPVQQQETKQNEEVEINTQRISLIESVVVRLMKRNKKMSHNELIQEVSTSLSSRFRPPIQLVKKAIESLIEREYLARSDVLKDDYVYVD